MSSTAIFKDPSFLKHVIEPGHPESPQRLESIYSMLGEPEMAGLFEELAPRLATLEEITLNHSSPYAERIAATSGRPSLRLDPDTGTSAGSWVAAARAVGAVLDGVDRIMAGSAANGFALVRPPGHHAERDRAMGFCLFNNVAIGASYLVKKYSLKRVLVIDWDIHHGNGTQHSFYADPQVLYFSTHQYPYYPGTGAFEETGEKAGKGFTVNVPLPGGQGDSDFALIFREILTPLAEAFNPEFILVSAGYDIYEHDPLGTMQVTPQGFYELTRILRQMAEKLCHGRLFLTLEGGYNVQGITQSVKETIFALSGKKDTREIFQKHPQPLSVTHSIIEKVKKVHAPFWASLL